MKLWYSNASPFARKVRAVIAHHQLQSQIECLLTPNSHDPNSPHNKDNPLGRVPALQLANSQWLVNSSFIAEYLDALGKNEKLIAQTEDRWQVQQLHYFADGILENEMSLVPEKLHRPSNEWWQERHQIIFARTQKSLEKLSQMIAPFDYALNLGTLNAVCTIDYLAFRDNLTHASQHPHFANLQQWAAQMNEKYSCLAQTKP